MNIADSSAVLQDRVLVQHQAALSVIRSFTQDPSLDEVIWLDLACGRGQILVNVENAIPQERRAKVSYIGVDISNAYAREAKERASRLFGSARVEVCDIQNFERVLGNSEAFHVITFTNTVHEIHPEDLADALVSLLCRLAPGGCLFAYDMERLPVPELGAVPWKGIEVEKIFHAILRQIGVQESALPDVAVWPHRTCSCWNLQLHRHHIDIDDLGALREGMTLAAATSIREILGEKLVETYTALSTACEYGCETEGERVSVQALLFEFWAIARALGLPFDPGKGLN